MRHKKHWDPVYVSDLADGVTPESVGWRVGEDGQLCRGPKGDQKLYKQTKERRAITREARTLANMKGIGSAKAVKESVANAAGSQLGSEAADYTHGNIHVTGADRIVGGA